MAKDKVIELQYKLEKLKRTKVRKAKRRALRQERKKEEKKCDCGDWCFCGSNTPGIIDY